MKHTFLIVVSILWMNSCQTADSTSKQSLSPVNYQTIDYIAVGKAFDTIEPPYVIDLKKGDKHLIFIGNDHNNDPTHKQYPIIENKFNQLRPQIAFNEGGQIPDSLHFSSASEAILRKGNTGFLKYLSDKAGIKMIDGDTEESLEFPLMLRRYPKDKLFLYYIMERLVIPYINGAHGQVPFEPLYEKAVAKWFVGRGYPLSEKERDITYFKDLYQQYLGKPFVAELNADVEKFDYINGGDCEFCAIGRASKMVRDSVLLTKIEGALEEYDRVIVTFGHGHALAVEPALKQIINKKR